MNLQTEVEAQLWESIRTSYEARNFTDQRQERPIAQGSVRHGHARAPGVRRGPAREARTQQHRTHGFESRTRRSD